MNNVEYFKSAWGDIKNSPGWFGKLCLLTLLNFIPIFGQIVTLGYLYGWAREIAWGAHEPMPEKIFANEDGKLYRRGWFVLVLTFVFSLVPYLIVGLGNSIQSLGVAQTFFGQTYVANGGWIAFGQLVNVLGYLALIFIGILAWVGNMRIAIYDRLSAGFQFSKIWKMFRHDTGGIMRIFGMELLVGLIIGIVLTVVFTVLFSIVAMAGVSGLLNAGYSIDALQYMTNAQATRVLLQLFASSGALGILVLLGTVFLATLAGMFVQMLVVRALGYWTMQFDVPMWDGQDDPMPFELLAGKPAAQSSSYYQQQAGSSYQAPYQPQGQPQQQAPGQASYQPQSASQGQPQYQPQGQGQAPHQPGLQGQASYQPQGQAQPQSQSSVPVQSFSLSDSSSPYARAQSTVPATPDPGATPPTAPIAVVMGGGAVSEVTYEGPSADADTFAEAPASDFGAEANDGSTMASGADAPSAVADDDVSSEGYGHVAFSTGASGVDPESAPTEILEPVDAAEQQPGEEHREEGRGF